MEGVFEEESQLRRCVEQELLSEPNVSPEQALKVRRAAALHSSRGQCCQRKKLLSNPTPFHPLLAFKNFSKPAIVIKGP